MHRLLLILLSSLLLAAAPAGARAQTAEVWADTVTVEPGDPATVTLQARIPAGAEVYGWFAEVTFDSLALRYVDVDRSGTLSGNCLVVKNGSLGGFLRLAAACSQPMALEGPLLRIGFEVDPDVAPGTEVPIVLQNFYFNEGLPPSQVGDGLVVVGTLGAAPALAPRGLSLAPNPVQRGRSLTLHFRGAAPTGGEFEIFDARGRRLLRRQLRIPAGAGPLRLEPRTRDGRLLPPGVYYYRLRGEKGRWSGKLAILR